MDNNGTGVRNNSSVDFEISVFSHILVCFLSPPCNFWLTFKHFLTKILHFLQLSNPKLSKITLPEKLLTVLYTNGHISKSRRNVNLDSGIKLKLKVCSFNTMIPKTHFTQNVTCSQFCGRASHILKHKSLF